MYLQFLIRKDLGIFRYWHSPYELPFIALPGGFLAAESVDVGLAPVSSIKWPCCSSVDL